MKDTGGGVKTRDLYVRHKDHVGGLIFVFGVQNRKPCLNRGREGAFVPDEGQVQWRR